MSQKPWFKLNTSSHKSRNNLYQMCGIAAATFAPKSKHKSKRNFSFTRTDQSRNIYIRLSVIQGVTKYVIATPKRDPHERKAIIMLIR